MVCNPTAAPSRGLAEEIRQYFILDFSNWKDHDLKADNNSRSSAG
jgi:hypothetical protein